MSHTATAAVPRSAFGQKLFEDLQALSANSRMTVDQMETIYALAYAHVTQGQYAQALPVFSILATYGPTRKHYIAGLALCLQMCERYEEAIAAYSLLSMLNPDGLEPSLQVAECMLMLGRTADAADELDRLLCAIVEAGGRFDALKPRAQVLVELANKQVSVS